MIVGLIILFLIGIYAVYVVQKKVKDFKNGKHCSCGCSDCPSSSKCHTKIKEEK